MLTPTSLQKAFKGQRFCGLHGVRCYTVHPREEESHRVGAAGVGLEYAGAAAVWDGLSLR